MAPLTPAGRTYALCWTETSTGDLVFADTADTAEDLLASWIDGYRDADTTGRTTLRARHAATVRARLAAQLVVDAETNGSPGPRMDRRSRSARGGPTLDESGRYNDAQSPNYQSPNYQSPNYPWPD